MVLVPDFHSSLKICFVIITLDLLFESYGWNVIDHIVSSYFDANRWFSEILCLKKFIDCRAAKCRVLLKFCKRYNQSSIITV